MNSMLRASCRPARVLAVGLWLGSSLIPGASALAPAQSHPPAPLPDSADGSNAWESDEQIEWFDRLGDPLSLSGSGEDCSAAMPCELPPRPAQPALGVLLADGRPARWDALVPLGSEQYWGMEQCCATLGLTLLWDPALFRGELRIDTLAFRFVLGGEVIHCGEQALQMRGPIEYAGNRLLLPLSGLARMIESHLGARFTFDADPPLLAQKPLGPLIGDVRIQDVSGRTYLRWSLPRSPDADLLTDGGRGLVVDLPGLFIDPAAPPRVAGRGGTCLNALLPGSQGTRFTFLVDPAVIAWRSQWLADRKEFQVILSSRPDDLVTRSGYQAWPGTSTVSVSRGTGRVVLVLPHERAWAGRIRDEGMLSDTQALIADLGRRVREALSQRGYEVETLEDSFDAQRLDWVAAANQGGGLVCVNLRPAFCGDSLAPGVRIMTAAADPLRRQLVSLEAAAPQVMNPAPTMFRGEAKTNDPVLLPRWDWLALRHGPGSEELGWLLALHLEAALAAQGVSESSVIRQRWPASAHQGLEMPAVVLYLGRLGTGRIFPADADWAAIGRVAEAVALSIEAYAIRHGEAP
ncbi:MAG: hypothetical protein V1774_02480 [Candidatus Eisenbacteria bacterium]